MQAIKATRPGGSVSYVGVPHGVSLDGQQLFFSHVHLHGGAVHGVGSIARVSVRRASGFVLTP